MTSYTIEQLVDKVNSLMSSEDIKDARVSSQLSVRRVRDYQSKGLLREPIRVGRNSFYDEQHVEQLVALRSMQSSGLSDGVLKKITDSSPLYYQTSDFQADTALSQSQTTLNSISESNERLLANDEMKKKALSVLDKLASNSSPTLGATTSSQVTMQSVANSVLSMNRSATSSSYNTEKQKLLDKGITGATRHQNRSLPEPSLNNISFASVEDLMKLAQPTPVLVKSYQVFDGVRLDIEDKAPLSNDDKKLIIDKLTKIINSM